MTTSATHRAIDAVWRIESAKLIAGLTRIVRDVGIAEDLAQDALVAALERWPESGVPDNPGAWLMATAKHRAIDLLRRDKLLERKHEQVGHELEAKRETIVPELDAALDDHVGDDLLRLLFISCHPVLSIEARVALTLRLLGGLTTEEIARAFLVPEPTIAQRIVRAKRTLSEARVPFEVPRGEALVARISSVLQVIYLIFNEGLFGDRRRRLDATDALRRSAATRTRHGRARARRSPRSTGSSRSWKSRRPGREPESGREANRSCSWTRTARGGIMSSFAAVSRRSNARRSSAARADRTRSRRRSPPAMPER